MRVNASIKRKENQGIGGGRLLDQKVLKKENNKNTKLLERGLRTGTTQVAPEEGLARHARFTLM